jgi:hypothetical protein
MTDQALTKVLLDGGLGVALLLVAVYLVRWLITTGWPNLTKGLSEAVDRMEQEGKEARVFFADQLERERQFFAKQLDREREHHDKQIERQFSMFESHMQRLIGRAKEESR